LNALRISSCMEFLLVAAVALVMAVSSARAEDDIKDIDVIKSPTCSCCSLWMQHLDAAGFKTRARHMTPPDLARVKSQSGLRPELHSCHTGFIGGYVIEGHVPADDVKRLLAERPDAIGLVVPGMPMGSPGMEAGDHKEPYDVLLLKRDGSTDVFARH